MTAVQTGAFGETGIPCDNVLKAASARDSDIAALKRDVYALKWMLGFILALLPVIFAKLFVH